MLLAYEAYAASQRSRIESQRAQQASPTGQSCARLKLETPALVLGHAALAFTCDLAIVCAALTMVSALAARQLHLLNARQWAPALASLPSFARHVAASALQSSIIQ